MWDSIIIWFVELSSTSQLCICSLLVISIIGSFRLLFLVYKEWYADPKLVNKYIEQIILFSDKYNNGIDNGAEIIFILRKSEQVASLLNEKFPDSPVGELAANIKFSNVLSYQTLANTKRRIFANCLKWDEKRKIRKWFVTIQLFLPIVFWPFRGIEVLLQLLSYLLKMVGLNIFDSKGKVAVVLASIGGIVGFLGNIASILSFMGVSIK